MEQWYKNAIFYGVEIKTFYDGNNDGVGDFVGLTEKLDYLSTLGITCIWILPFYPSSNRDNGYDVTDYYNVDPAYGTLDEFKICVKEAKKRNIRVIIDLVVHHTSILHPWFLEARRNPDSKYRNYYVWTKEVPDEHYEEDRPAFPGVEEAVWSFDGVAKEFYFHKFYHFQPDLNTANVDVQEEIFNIVDFWLACGVSGFRIDAATMLFERKGIEGTEVPNPEEFLNSLHTFIKAKNKDAILLAEADVVAKKVQTYFGSGQRMHLLYNFLLNRYIFLALARGDGSPIREELSELPVPPSESQWVNFLRNLDELNIEQLKESEQQEVYAAFGPDDYMQVYHRGIRRRMAPMLQGNLRRLKMSYSLLFALPGAALIVYGDEIGMGECLDLPEREAVRIPMQWDGTKNAGFSIVNPKGIVRMVLSEGHYGYKSVNVVEQEKDEGSLFNHLKHLIKIKKKHPEFGKGIYRLIDVDPSTVLAMSYDYEGDVTIAVHNLSEKPVDVTLTQFKHTDLEEFFADGIYFKNEKPTAFPLNGYGYRWFSVKRSK